MKYNGRVIGLLLCLLWSPLVVAVIDIYHFANQEQQERFYALTHELRCPKCQNQSIADSDSPIANDLRREVYRMLLAGESDRAIIDFMIARYGEFVRYRPSLASKTLLLWVGPPLFLLIGLSILIVILRRHHK